MAGDFPSREKSGQWVSQVNVTATCSYLLVRTHTECLNWTVKSNADRAKLPCKSCVLYCILFCLADQGMNLVSFAENDKPMKGLRQEDLVNQELITDLRKEFRMTYNDFYMVLTDMDMKWKVR